MKYRKGIYLEYNTRFSWEKWYGKWIHVYKVVMNKPIKAIINIKKEDVWTIDKFYRQ